VCAGAFALERRPHRAPAPAAPPVPHLPPPRAAAVVFATGFASFGLEVAWFRALRAAFLSSTDSFAVMLFAVLLGLGAGAQLAPPLRRRGIAPGWLLAGAAVAILLATPVVERMDLLCMDLFVLVQEGYAERILRRAGLALAALGPAMLLLGTALPW